MRVPTIVTNKVNKPNYCYVINIKWKIKRSQTTTNKSLVPAATRGFENELTRSKLTNPNNMKTK